MSELILYSKNMIKHKIIDYELYFIYLLQKYLTSKYIFDIVLFNKKLTSLKSIYVYLTIVLYYDVYLFLYIVLLLGISRKTNYYIKNYYKKERPYNRNPLYIKFYKKRKYSYSFPSQSILNISVFYNTIYYYKQYNDYVWFSYATYIYYMLLVLLSITRMYRGLHYPHDIIISYLYGIYIVKYIMWII